MKKLLLCCLVLGGFASLQVSAAEIPNLEASVMYDFTTKELVPGLTSKMLSVGDVDLRVGYTAANTGVCCLSYNLKNLEKFGSKVKYLWGESVQTSLGFWCGYNFKNEVFSYGISAVMIEVKF